MRSGQRRSACGGGKLFGARARNRLGQIEQSVIFALAEILRLKEFGQADDLRASSGGISDTAQTPFPDFPPAPVRRTSAPGRREIFRAARVDLRDQYSRKKAGNYHLSVVRQLWKSF